MKQYYIFLLIFVSISLKAQNHFDEGKIIQLHPSTGFAVTPAAKIKYNLFPQFQDSVFEYAQLVKYNDSSFTFIFRTKYDGRVERSTTIAEINDVYNKIEKINPASAKSVSHFNPLNTRQPEYFPVGYFANSYGAGVSSQSKRTYSEGGLDTCDKICAVVGKVLEVSLYILAKGHWHA
jgi:hypothetical protein